jgi:hypothetical protein
MGLSSSYLYVVGEIDYRALAFDQPWFSSCNIGLRHATELKRLPDPHLDKLRLQDMVQYKKKDELKIQWMMADNLDQKPEDPLMNDRNRARQCAIAVVRCQRNLLTGSLNTGCHIERVEIVPEKPGFSYARK